jgi:molybdopterin synthase catalytic subunit
LFVLTDQPIEKHPALLQKQAGEAGAKVIFEGRVRNRNEGRQVLRLEYEGAAALSANEFSHIEQEARVQFDIADLICVHRIGTLQIGELAVWIAVQAGHRGAAFDACRYVIEQLKQRLPIWKKEYYLEGDSGWINHP